jgi:hypothetical protein
VIVVQNKVISDKIKGKIGLIFIHKPLSLKTHTTLNAFERKNVEITIIIVQTIQAIKAQTLFINMLEKDWFLGAKNIKVIFYSFSR